MKIKAKVIPIKVSASRSKRVREHNESRRNTSDVLITKTGENEIEGEPPSKKQKRDNHCHICKRRNHTIEKCRDFLKEKLNQRWKIVRNGCLCYLCLQEGHVRNDCQTRQACTRCGRNLNTTSHFTPRNDYSNPTETRKEENHEKSERPVNITSNDSY